VYHLAKVTVAITRHVTVIAKHIATQKMYSHILYQLAYDASCIKNKITVIRHVTMIAMYKTTQEMYSPNTGRNTELKFEKSTHTCEQATHPYYIYI